jgi:hypothetical protein
VNAVMNLWVLAPWSELVTCDIELPVEELLQNILITFSVRMLGEIVLNFFCILYCLS